MRLFGWGALVFVIACFESHRVGPAEGDGGFRPMDAATDRADSFIERPDACLPEPAPDDGFESANACRIPFADGCDGERVFDPICPICPHVDAEVIDGMPCDVPDLACEYSGAGFCNFWGCGCEDSDGDGVLRWQCWWPLC